MGKLRLQDLDLANKKILVRVDFNVPLNEQGEITDDTRIRASLPTIQYILDHGGQPILMSHLGRPKGKADPKFSLEPCAVRLQELLGIDVGFTKGGQVTLLENLRFHKGEEHPEEDPGWVKNLATLGDLYINDAFGTAHRSHGSTAVIAQYFPGKAAAGLLLQKEIAFLGETVENPKRPFIAIIGGAKVSTKLGALKSLLGKVDKLLVGGGMAYTFLKGKGIPIGDSLCEDELVATTRSLPPEKILLPTDLVIAKDFSNEQTIQVADGVPEGFEGVDIGPQTIVSWKQIISGAATLFWNGPVGVFEKPPFDRGTNAIAAAVGESDAISIVGGGDSVAAVNKSGMADQISHISTGGGASLEFIEKGSLPGIDALSDL